VSREFIFQTYFQVRVLSPEDGGLPPAVQVVGKGTGANEAKAVLFGEVLYFNSNGHWFDFRFVIRESRFVILF